MCPVQIVEGGEEQTVGSIFNLTACCTRRGECGPAISLQKGQNYLLGYVFDNAY